MVPIHPPEARCLQMAHPVWTETTDRHTTRRTATTGRGRQRKSATSVSKQIPTNSLPPPNLLVHCRISYVGSEGEIIQ